MEVTISVVVPVRMAESTIESTLESAISQASQAGGEVIAAVWREDPSLERIERLAARHPGVLRVVIAGRRCGIPQLRRDGVRAARGPWVVITEDHCLFPSGWLAGMLSGPGDVRGGAVANGRCSYAGWAQYFTRYSAFLPPAPDGPSRHLSGNNACYARGLLDSPSLDEGFWEAEFNRELIARGARFFLCSNLTIEQRQQRGWLEYVPLRFHHGRSYGARRGGSKLGWLLRAPLIPAVLIWRMVRAQWHKRYHPGWFVLTFPLLVCYVMAWSLGELVGSLRGPGKSSKDTD
jgi:glycosyltransferase involved in cell wall biosynthesis